MGIAKKNKRKIIYQNKEFYWWVLEKIGDNGNMLEINIASEDKSFLISYFTIQDQAENKYLTVIGKSFPGLKIKKGNWQRFICPDFIPDIRDNGISPKNVVFILKWCFNLEKKLIPVNYKGQIINNE